MSELPRGGGHLVDAAVDEALDVPKAHEVNASSDPNTVRRIGLYRILRELGRGGMGVVYLAERDDGQYKRQVAVKLLRAGADADELRRRFLAERQILASLSHPNIAQLLDGGVADGGLPYLVMEYVDGVPITEYCDRHRLGLDARLRLFQNVCAAVHHAHQNLVLHRDLKPGNVLVTSAAQVKLLDFGIAKLLNPALLGEDQPVTRTAFRVMTPAYASPEQVRGDSLTTASDVYALGLLLYEMLVGRPAQRIDTDAPQSVYDAVCRQEPDRPSAVAPRDAETAAARDSTPDRLRRRLRGDIDAIVMMAVRKEPRRRYGSAELLAADIGRYLDGLPVRAHRGNRWYHLEKRVRRHPFAALSALLLVVGAVVALALATVAAHERDRAAQTLATSQGALRESEAVSAFLVSLFEASDPTTGRQDSLTAAALLSRGVSRAEQLGSEPLAQARMLEALGRVYESVDSLPIAEQLLRRSLALRRLHSGPANAQTTNAQVRLAQVLWSRGQYAAADSLARDALRSRRLALPDTHPDVAASLRQVASFAGFFGDFRAAETYRRDVVAADRVRGADSALVEDLLDLSTTLRSRGDDRGAERMRREAREVARRAFPKPNPDRVLITFGLAELLDERMTSWPEAESLAREAVAEARVAFGETHALTGEILGALGSMLARHGRQTEAERLSRQAIELERRALGSSNLGTASGMLSLAMVLSHDGYSPEAERLTRDAVAIFKGAYGAQHPMYAGALGYLADVLVKRGALDSAETLYREALTIRRGVPGTFAGIIAVNDAHLARVIALRGRFAEADSLYHEALAVQRSYIVGTHLNLRLTYDGLAALYEAWGKRDSAAVFRRLAQPPGYAPPWQR